MSEGAPVEIYRLHLVTGIPEQYSSGSSRIYESRDDLLSDVFEAVMEAEQTYDARTARTQGLDRRLVRQWWRRNRSDVDVERSYVMGVRVHQLIDGAWVELAIEVTPPSVTLIAPSGEG